MNAIFADQPYTWAIQQIRAAVGGLTPIYLTGGAVRDLLLGRPTHDLDFTLPANALAVSRKIARALQAAFYALNHERDTGRVILTDREGKRLILDFAVFRGENLEADLRHRDFTINAMAIDLEKPDTLIDPLKGADDLRARVLRICSPYSLRNDPVRVLRGARLSVDLAFKMEPLTRQLTRQAAPGLQQVSTERLRDELFKILELTKPAAVLRLLDLLEILPYALPDLAALKGIQQSPPHILDVWEHTLAAAQRFSDLILLLSPEYHAERSTNWAYGLATLRLGRYRHQLADHLAKSLNPDRSLWSLLMLGALYHDAGKAATRQVDETNHRVRFLEHEQKGAALAQQYGENLHLSNQEIDRLHRFVRGHMRPFLLAQTGAKPTERALYRYYRDLGETGVDIALFSLADALATYGHTLPQEIWVGQLDVSRCLLEAWWEKAEQVVSPKPLLNGNELMEKLGLQPGPQIGQILEAIREAQAAGELHNQQQAFELARSWLDRLA